MCEEILRDCLHTLKGNELFSLMEKFPYYQPYSQMEQNMDV